MPLGVCASLGNLYPMNPFQGSEKELFLHHRGQGNSEDKEMTERLLYLGPQKVVSLPMGMEGLGRSMGTWLCQGWEAPSEVFQADSTLAGEGHPVPRGS